MGSELPFSSSSSPSSSTPPSSSASAPAPASASKKDHTPENREAHASEESAVHPTGRPRTPSPFRYLGERSRSPSPSELTDRNSPDAIDINPYGLTAESMRSDSVSEPRPWVFAPAWEPPPLLQSPCEEPPATVEKTNFDTKFVFSPAQAPFLSPSILTNPDFLDPDYFEKRQQTLQRMQSSSTCRILKRVSDCSTSSSSETAAATSANVSACSSGEDATRSAAPNLLSTAVAIVNSARDADERDANATAEKKRKIGKNDASYTSESATKPAGARSEAAAETHAMLDRQDNNSDNSGKGS